jgi:hypothetical protein
MTFTTNDIRENKKLAAFIRTRIRPPEKTKVMNKNLYNVYNTKCVIKQIDRMILKHSKGTNCTKYIPVWKKHIEFLESL